jgi:serine/threonine protein kinase
MDDYSTHQISLDFETYFSTESDSYGNITSISVFGDRVVHLAHPNPTVLEQWASLLHQNIHKTGFHKDYALLNKIGEGVSAKVYIAKAERGGFNVAVKAFSKKTMEKKDW